ncbi:25261_t:CDS:2 [Gigaspora margarita]|uniref:25261_t:CDS:1 n=1 Tax=Gigaspora margarita TaxID=4874 RepID=A0ABM8W6F7_GIGMA|nr:25261_t:CDS:2 [Gigaspora margarita]
METPTCSGCNQNLSVSEFMGVGAKGKPKQYRTCNNYRYRTSEYKNTKKRLQEFEIEGDQEDSEVLEITNLNNLSNHVLQLLNEVAKELVELIENVDEFAWMYEIRLHNLSEIGLDLSDTLIKINCLG